MRRAAEGGHTQGLRVQELRAPTVPGTTTGVRRDPGTRGSKAKLPRGTGGGHRPALPSAGEAKGTGVWSGAGASEGGAEGCARVPRLLNAEHPAPGRCSAVTRVSW